MFSICLIVPTWNHYADPFLHQPYWELYFATILQNHFSNEDISVGLADLRGIAEESLANTIRKIPQHDLFIHWVFKTNAAIDHYSIARQLKELYPKSIQAAGGTHVELQTEECSTKFDTVVVGPGENSFVKIVKDIRAGNLQKVYRQDWKEVPFWDTPFPRRDFLPINRVVNTNQFKEYGGLRGTTMYTSRGCIYNCSFCTLNVPRALQMRSPEMISAEIKYLKENFGVEAVTLKDEVAINPNPKISAKVFDALSKFSIIWRGQTTVLASYEQLKMAHQSGCRELAVGIETVDDQVMKTINKPWQNRKNIHDFIVNAKKAGIKIKTCLILGLPGEPLDIVEKSIKFIEDNEIDYVNISGLSPLPGSVIYNNPKRYGIKFISKDWSKHANLLCRYSDEEEVGLPFEYEKEASWGRTFTREQIMENIRQLQRWLRSRNMVY